MVGDGDDEADGKSSLAPMASPRSTTLAVVPQTAASATDRVQSSNGIPYYHWFSSIGWVLGGTLYSWFWT